MEKTEYEIMKVCQRIVRRLVDKVTVKQVREWYNIIGETGLSKTLREHPDLLLIEIEYIYKTILRAKLSKKDYSKVSGTDEDIRHLMSILDYRVPFAKMKPLVYIEDGKLLLNAIMELTNDCHKANDLFKAVRQKQMFKWR